MTKVLFYISVFLISTIESFAQSDSILFQKDSPSGKVLLEEYSISKDSVKNGPYKKFNAKGKRLMEGQYTDGKPSGIWVYYEANNWNRIYSKFDWSSMKEIEFHFVSNRTRTHASDSFCRFPGGDVVYQQYLDESISKISRDHSETKGKAKITYMIGPNGKVILEEIIWFDKEGNKQPINPKLESDLRTMFETMPAWIYCSEVNTSKFRFILPVLFE